MSSDTIWPCTENDCKHVSPSIQGLRSHLKKTHGLAVADVPRNKIKEIKVKKKTIIEESEEDEDAETAQQST